MESVGLDFIGQVVLIGLVVFVGVVAVEFGPMLKARYVMSRHSPQADGQADEKPAVSAVKRNDESSESSAAMPKVEGDEKFQFQDGFMVLAALVKAGKVGETEGLELAFKVKSGGSPRYKIARGRLTEALSKLDQPQYPPLTEAQRATRQEMRLPLRD